MKCLEVGHKCKKRMRGGKLWRTKGKVMEWKNLIVGNFDSGSCHYFEFSKIVRDRCQK